GVRAAETEFSADSANARLHSARAIQRSHYQHARSHWIDRVAGGQDAQSPNERHLSHRLSTVRPDSDRGRLPGKRYLALHALVLWPARYRLRQFGGISPELDQARFRSREVADPSPRARHRTLS